MTGSIKLVHIQEVLNSHIHAQRICMSLGRDNAYRSKCHFGHSS